MNRSLVTLLLLITGVGCNSKHSIVYPEGGYSYLENIHPADTNHYFLPLRDSIPLEDSMLYADAGAFYRSFNEGNLSIRPDDEDVFRLAINGGLIWSTIIIITKEEMIVKQHKKESNVSPYPEEEPGLLPEQEAMYYYFLIKHFPFSRKFGAAKRQYVDSMLIEYPFLRDGAYYRSLKDKATVRNSEPFQYTTISIPFNPGFFEKWVSSINTSGYWTLPYHNVCVAPPSDGYGFTLEANTKEKYKVVSCSVCADNADAGKLKKACQEILDYAGIKDDFKVWWPGEVNR